MVDAADKTVELKATEDVEDIESMDHYITL